MFPYYENQRNGRHRVIEIEVVKNGWLVTYYPKPENPSAEETKEFMEKQLETEKERLARSLKEQAASMKIAGEAMLRIKEAWQDPDEEDPDSFKKIDEIAEKITEMHPVKNDLIANLGVFGRGSFFPKDPVSMIFTDKNELLKFIAESV